jgi:hypothetical protein
VPDKIQIISLEERERWQHQYLKGGLPCHSWTYAWGLSASGVEPKLAVVCAGGARMLLPFFERRWLGMTDVTTIVGLSGASITPSSACAPLSLWHEFAAEQSWIAGYIQLAISVEPDPASVLELTPLNRTRSGLRQHDVFAG